MLENHGGRGIEQPEVSILAREPFGARPDYAGETENAQRAERTVTDTQDSDARAREDEWLVVRCQLGERPAFDELVARWGGPVWKYVRRLTNTDEVADEIAQDVWLRVLRGLHQLRDGAKLRAWLFRIARRTLMDRLREHYTTPAMSQVDVTDLVAANDINDATEDLEQDLAAVQEALARLPVVEREALTLFYLRELSLGEVADVLGVPIGTVKSRLFRARKLLRREVEPGTRR